MKMILPGILLVLSCLIPITGGTDDVTQQWYYTQMSQNVVPPYKEAYTTLQQKVLNPLLTNVNTTNDTAVSQLVSSLTCSIQNLDDQLTTAVNESQKLRIQIDQNVVEAVAAVSAKEQQITAKQGEIHTKTTEIQGVQNQLTTAEQGLRDKQQGLADAENALRIAQEKVEEAKKCITGRRKKRWLGSIWNPIRDTITKPIQEILRPVQD
ncbi:unnamed protein product, partial [Didymodactylos carnosus]